MFVTETPSTAEAMMPTPRTQALPSPSPTKCAAIDAQQHANKKPARWKEFYSHNAVRLRAQLLHHEVIETALTSVWEAVKASTSDNIDVLGLSEGNYALLHHKLVLALQPAISPAEAEAAAREDWARDAVDGRVDRNRFKWTWYELADLYTPSMDPADLAEFTRETTELVVETRADGTVVGWRDDKEVLRLHYRRRRERGERAPRNPVDTYPAALTRWRAAGRLPPPSGRPAPPSRPASSPSRPAAKFTATLRKSASVPASTRPSRPASPRLASVARAVVAAARAEAEEEAPAAPLRRPTSLPPLRLSGVESAPALEAAPARPASPLPLAVRRHGGVGGAGRLWRRTSHPREAKEKWELEPIAPTVTASFASAPPQLPPAGTPPLRRPPLAPLPPQPSVNAPAALLAAVQSKPISLAADLAAPHSRAAIAAARARTGVRATLRR